MDRSTFCREQESRQRALALSADLANSRDIATIAADAWAKEGATAERREARDASRKAAETSSD